MILCKLMRDDNRALALTGATLQWDRGNVFTYELGKGVFSYQMTISASNISKFASKEEILSRNYISCSLLLFDSNMEEKDGVKYEGSFIITGSTFYSSFVCSFIQNVAINFDGKFPDVYITTTTENYLIKYSGTDNDKRQKMDWFYPSVENIELYNKASKYVLPSHPIALRVDKIFDLLDPVGFDLITEAAKNTAVLLPITTATPKSEYSKYYISVNFTMTYSYYVNPGVTNHSTVILNANQKDTKPSNESHWISEITMAESIYGWIASYYYLKQDGGLGYIDEERAKSSRQNAPWLFNPRYSHKGSIAYDWTANTYDPIKKYLNTDYRTHGFIVALPTGSYVVTMRWKWKSNAVNKEEAFQTPFISFFALKSPKVFGEKINYWNTYNSERYKDGDMQFNFHLLPDATELPSEDSTSEQSMTSGYYPSKRYLTFEEQEYQTASTVINATDDRQAWHFVPFGVVYNADIRKDKEKHTLDDVIELNFRIEPSIEPEIKDVNDKNTYVNLGNCGQDVTYETLFGDKKIGDILKSICEGSGVLFSQSLTSASLYTLEDMSNNTIDDSVFEGVVPSKINYKMDGVSRFVNIKDRNGKLARTIDLKRDIYGSISSEPQDITLSDFYLKELIPLNVDDVFPIAWTYSENYTNYYWDVGYWEHDDVTGADHWVTTGAGESIIYNPIKYHNQTAGVGGNAEVAVNTKPNSGMMVVKYDHENMVEIDSAALAIRSMGTCSNMKTWDHYGEVVTVDNNTAPVYPVLQYWPAGDNPYDLCSLNFVKCEIGDPDNYLGQLVELAQNYFEIEVAMTVSVADFKRLLTNNTKSFMVRYFDSFGLKTSDGKPGEVEDHMFVQKWTLTTEGKLTVNLVSLPPSLNKTKNANR